MSKIVSVEIALSEKISQNYNSWSIDVSASAQLEEGETLEQVSDDLTDKLSQQVTRQFARYFNHLNQAGNQQLTP